VFVGVVNQCNKGLLGTEAALLGCKTTPIGFLLSDPDGPQVWRGKPGGCIPGALYKDPTAGCLEGAGYLATPIKGGNRVVWVGLVPGINENLLSTDSCFIPPGNGNSFIEENGRYRRCDNGVNTITGRYSKVAATAGYIYGR
jgi:hypothetical protein